MITSWSPRLLELEAELSPIIPDQPVVIGSIGQAIRRKLALQSETQRPLGKFLLVGASDKVNKLAKELARFLFGSADNVLCLNMQDYSEKHQVWGLMAHPGGMVRAYFEGDLTSPILKQPETVAILENIESAHVDAWHILLPILQEGFVVDGLGQGISFKNSVLILSTTIGWRENSDIFPSDSREVIERCVLPEVLRTVDNILLVR